MRWLAFAFLLLASPAQACPGLEPCQVKGGQYLALPPAGWDGKASLPTTIFFHGYGASAASFAGDRAFVQAFASEGVLLVLPDGLDHAWSFRGSPEHRRDDLAFMDRVRADLIQRFHADPQRLLVTGFSIGGSLAWDLACERGHDYRAFAPASGAFWDPLPTSCPTGPVDLYHTHGLADHTVPMDGRVIARVYHQGNVERGIALWREIDGCATTPDATPIAGDGSQCRVWSRCTSGREVRLCLHPGGHMMPEGWVHAIHEWGEEPEAMTRLTSEAKGVYLIAATPFGSDGALDLPGLDRLIDWYLGHGVHGLTILGQMGEAPKLTHEESVAVVRRVLARATVPVVVGVSSPGFAAMRALSGAAMDAGAAGVMVARPGR